MNSPLLTREHQIAAHLYYDFSQNKWATFAKQLQSLPKLKDLPFAVRNYKDPPENWSKALDCCRNLPYKTITYDDENYPYGLKKLSSPPPVLYQLGAPIPAQTALVSVVGTRRPSAFGVTLVRDVVRFFTSRNLGIVSGLALGIDQLAHSQSIAEKSYTLAVLGNGLDQIYPRPNRRLADDIISTGGTILTQFPPGTIPHPTHFPRRNFLIAALSAGTLAIEGTPKSGAYITAKAALDLSLSAIAFTQDFRKEFGAGAVQLIRAGGTPVTNLTEAYEAIAMPFGGKIGNSQNANENRPFKQDLELEFTLTDFQALHNLSIAEAIREIAKLKQAGEIIDNTLGTYRKHR